jgi:hypothetical protein
MSLPIVLDLYIEKRLPTNSVQDLLPEICVTFPSFLIFLSSRWGQISGSPLVGVRGLRVPTLWHFATAFEYKSYSSVQLFDSILFCDKKIIHMTAQIERIHPIKRKYKGTLQVLWCGCLVISCYYGC